MGLSSVEYIQTGYDKKTYLSYIFDKIYFLSYFESHKNNKD